MIGFGIQGLGVCGACHDISPKHESRLRLVVEVILPFSGPKLSLRRNAKSVGALPEASYFF